MAKKRRSMPSVSFEVFSASSKKLKKFKTPEGAISFIKKQRKRR